MVSILNKAAKSASKQITNIVTAIRKREGGGFIVRRPIPGAGVRMVDPILMIDHIGPIVYGPGEALGAPDHPHRGITTATVILDGEWEHKDSNGNSGHLGPGGVQWMTAGRGVIHSEMPGTEIFNKGGKFHGFQIWFNIPAKDKMCNPEYNDVEASSIPTVFSEDKLTSVRVIAGKVGDVNVSSIARTPVYLLDVRIKPGAKTYNVRIPSNMNAGVYTYNSQSVIVGTEEQELKESQLAVFDLGANANEGEGSSDETVVPIRLPEDATEEAGVLIVAGVPLKEPVAQYGPFVMNTQEEIHQAMLDYQSGKFGKIEGEEERYAQTRQAQNKDKTVL